MRLLFGYRRRMQAALSLLLSLTFSLVACRGGSFSGGKNYLAQPEPSESKICGTVNLLATAFPAYDLAYSLLFSRLDAAGNLQKGQNPPLPLYFNLQLLGSGGDLHSYEPSLQDVNQMKRADLIISIGLSADYSLRRLKTELQNEDAGKFWQLTQHVDLLPLTGNVSGQPASKDEAEQLYDEHVWLSCKNQVKLLTALSRRLQSLVEAKFPAYAEDFHKFINKQLQERLQLWRNLDADYQRIIERAPLKTLIFADRFPLRYFCHDYQLKHYAAFNNCALSQDPSMKTLLNLQNKVKETGSRIIFYTEYARPKLAAVVAADSYSITARQAAALLHSQCRIDARFCPEYRAIDPSVAAADCPCNGPQEKAEPSRIKDAATDDRPINYIALWRSGHKVSLKELQAGISMYDLLRENLSLVQLACNRLYDSVQLNLQPEARTSGNEGE